VKIIAGEWLKKTREERIEKIAKAIAIWKIINEFRHKKRPA